MACTIGIFVPPTEDASPNLGDSYGAQNLTKNLTHRSNGFQGSRLRTIRAV